MRLVLCIGTAAKTLAFLIAELIVALAVYVLVVRAAVHTDYEHIYIIVTEAAAVALVAHLRQCKALYRLPVILNIACRTEKMSAALSYPLVYIIIAPVASGEHYRSAAVSEGGRHTLVEYLAGYMYGLVAIVIFQVVNAPLCERFCVLKFVLEAAGVTCAGMRAGTRIDAELKTL